MDEDYEGPVCPACGEPCKVVDCDSGQGWIEVWGARIFDSSPYLGSDCCSSEMDDTYYEESDDDGSDYLYDCWRDKQLDERDDP